SVTFHDALLRRVESGLVEWMLDHADQSPGSVARQTRIAVEGDAVADAAEDREVADTHDEARVVGTAEQAVELVNLASLAFPAHPAAFAVVPASCSVEEEE